MSGDGGRTPWRAYALGWVGLAGIGVANGVARGVLYERRLGETAAHRVSTATGIALIAPAIGAIERRHPLPSTRAALVVGAAWTAATVAFEFALGRLVARRPWRELAADYDLPHGRLWPLVLATIAAGPALARAARTRGRAG